MPPASTAVVKFKASDARSSGLSGVTYSAPVEDQAQDFPLSLDTMFHAGLARLTGGVSPTGFSQAFLDWWLHLLLSPDKQVALANKAFRKQDRLLRFMARSQILNCKPCIDPLPQDKRFDAEGWSSWPFNLYSQAFLLTQQWWHNATTDVPGVSSYHERVMTFTVRQMLDVFSPSNYVWSNPEVVSRTVERGGANLLQGLVNLKEDILRRWGGEPSPGSEAFTVGRDVAITPGKVIYRNRLIELIQYAPTTATVAPEPILIVPAWIMKYYILDLSPANSLVKYLVDHGYTVFVISWRNPDEKDSDLTLADYLDLGVQAALDTVSTVLPQRKIHGVGYCLGGTLLSIAAAAMARDGDSRLQSLTLFAAQTDFTEAGELMLFISEDQIRFLEDVMAAKGYLDAQQMAGAFQILRSNDLLWSRMVKEYLMGEREPMFDLMAWNADTTRMPYRMHSEYLRRLFLHNDLAEARFSVKGTPVSLRDIHAPLFCVSTIADHVAPWRSVYKNQMLMESDTTFVLSNGGHNAGIVNPPGTPRRHHQIATHRRDDVYVDPDHWQATATRHEGSWWPCWLEWLAARSGPAVALPPLGAAEQGLAPLGDAPGTYVMER